MDGWFEVFRAGEYPQGDVTAAQVDEIARNYNPAWREAPIVLGHPKDDDPAWGWVEAVKARAGTLLVRFRRLVPEFVQAVKAGRFGKVSVRLIQTARGWYLGHVGFLGAALPAVPGLAPIHFATGAPSVDFTMGFTAAAGGGAEGAMNGFGRTGMRDFHHEEEEVFRRAKDYEAAHPGVGFVKALFAVMDRDGSPRAVVTDNGPRPAGADDNVDPAAAALHAEVLAYQERHPGVDYRAAYRTVQFHREFPWLAPGADDGGGQDFALIDGQRVNVDADDAALHRRVLAFQEAHPGLSYAAALAEVQRPGPMEVTKGPADEPVQTMVVNGEEVPVEARAVAMNRRVLAYQAKHAGMDYTTAARAVFAGQR